MPEELGQENRERQVDFDSADIDKKEKATQFTIIEGEAERVKAAEKAKIAAKKEIEEIHKADVEAAAEIQQEVEKEQRREKGGPVYKIFGGWKKWAIIGCLAVLLGGFGVYFAFLRKPAEEEQSPVYTKETAESYYEEQSSKIDINSTLEERAAAVGEFEDIINQIDDNETKYYYLLYYAVFLRVADMNLSAAIDTLERAKSISDENYDACLWIYAVSVVYEGAPIDAPDSYYLDGGCEE